jgi:hypothetical protein
MVDYKFEIEGLDELKEAIARNPEIVKREIGNFLKRGMEVYTRIMLNKPWRVGETGGGVPVATGNLRDTHQLTYLPYEAYIQPTAPYAGPIHSKRPWLDYAFNQGQQKVEELENNLMEKIAEDLAK